MGRNCDARGRSSLKKRRKIRRALGDLKLLLTEAEDGFLLEREEIRKGLQKPVKALV